MYILIGAGGHSKVVLDILLSSHQKIFGFLDDNRMGNFASYPVLGRIDEIDKIIQEFVNPKFIVTIGDNHARKRIVKGLESLNINFGQAIHPSAIIGSNVSLGSGTVVMANTVINHSAEIGNHVIINTGSTIDHDCVVGNYSHVSPGANLAGNVALSELVHFGIAACAIQGIKVGRNSIVGAGSVVIRNLPAKTVSVGNPARPIKTLN
ncbi:acetyltransferase [Mesobacillus jeotgali]|uniref:Acetyltransferase n=1 Tax=Mesobacillus jeotgali TaxID=129985 RepID=A0ABY9VGC6_9BACI|nr:acetyltransferase [Mesobacillus jeotgali]WNF22643.1 acetyltransferase [Mesobacillus jeotgali]